MAAARRSLIADARAWLRETLVAGLRPAQELREEVAAHDVGEKAHYAPRKAEGITIAKERTAQGR